MFCIFFSLLKKSFKVFDPDSKQDIYLLRDFIAEEKLINEIVLEERGPDGIGRANGFYVLNIDSILITSKYRKTINIIDNDGHKIFSFNFWHSYYLMIK